MQKPQRPEGVPCVQEARSPRRGCKAGGRGAARSVEATSGASGMGACSQKAGDSEGEREGRWVPGDGGPAHPPLTEDWALSRVRLASAFDL